MKTNHLSENTLLIGRNCFLSVYLLAMCNLLLAQTAGVEQNITRLNVTLIGISGSSELKLGKVTTLFLEGGLNTYTELTNDIGDNLIFSIHPLLQAEPRLYYSFAKRERQKRNTNFNHGGFVALTAGYVFKSINEEYFKLNNRYFIGPVWGYNIAFRHRFSLETRLGVTYLGGLQKVGKFIDPDPQRILPITDIRFCILLNSKKT